MRFIASLYLTDRFFQVVLALAALFIISYVYPLLYPLGIGLCMLLLVLFVYDVIALYSKKDGLYADRRLADKMSNGDYNQVSLIIKNKYGYRAFLQVIDEIPAQFQYREGSWFCQLSARSNHTIRYKLKPFKRGEYVFGAINLYASTFVGLVQRRYRFDEDRMVPVYPSIIQMNKYEFAAISNRLHEYGIKKIRRIGHTMEFEQIKEYVVGDDPRTINWKASARSNTLMVNNYQDERSQSVYCIVDKGRLMRFPFGGLSLLDYAINAALVMSNIAIKKQDKAGLITFSDKLSAVVAAEKKSGQIKKILEVLYNQKTLFKEANFELLANYINRKINQRSLLLCFTNFESLASFNRQLPYFVSLSRRHLLVVIFFQNQELWQVIDDQPQDVREIYTQIIAEQYEYDKHLIQRRLQRYGIHSILTSPEDLSVNTINKYLELKAKGTF